MFDWRLLNLESSSTFQGGTYILTKGDNYTKVRKNLISLEKFALTKVWERWWLKLENLNCSIVNKVNLWAWVGLNFELGWSGLCHKFSSGFCGSHRSMGFAYNIAFGRAWDCRIWLSKLLQDMGDMNLNFVKKKLYHTYWISWLGTQWQ